MQANPNNNRFSAGLKEERKNGKPKDNTEGFDFMEAFNKKKKSPMQKEKQKLTKFKTILGGVIVLTPKEKTKLRKLIIDPKFNELVDE